MKLERQLVINEEARLKHCKQCGAGAKERCFQIRLGAKVFWDQAVHKARLRTLTGSQYV